MTPEANKLYYILLGKSKGKATPKLVRAAMKEIEIVALAQRQMLQMGYQHAADTADTAEKAHRSLADHFHLPQTFASAASKTAKAKPVKKAKTAKAKTAKAKTAKAKTQTVRKVLDEMSVPFPAPAKAKPAKKAKTAKHKAAVPATPVGLRISDPQAFAVLASLEGADWAAYQETDKLGPATFWANKMAFDVLTEGNLTKVADIADVLEAGGVVAGAVGSYLIQRGGRIRLLPGSTSEHEAAAKRLGITRL